MWILSFNLWILLCESLSLSKLWKAHNWLNIKFIIYFYFEQVSLVDAWETDKMFMLKFDTLPGTDVVTYLAEKSSYSEQMVADIGGQVS